MRLAILIPFLLSPGAAVAHIGHWAPVAGHDHIAIGITIGIAVVAGLTVLGKKGKEQASDDAGEDETESGAEA